MQLIIPASFMTLKVLKPFRRWVLDNYYIKNITIKNNENNDQFNIHMNDIVILQIQKTPTATTYNNDFEVVLNYNWWPLYTNKDDVELLVNTLINNRPVTVNEFTPRDKTNYISFGIKDHTYTRDNWRLNSVKESIKHHGYILFDSKEDAERNWEYYNTEEFNRCLRMIQSVNKIQPYFIQYIGKV